MTLWQKIQAALARVGNSFAELFQLPPPEASVGFTAAAVALSAKMAKADGIVTRDEVQAFRQVFVAREADMERIGRFFDLARRDTAGFELYAERIACMFSPGAEVLEDLLDSLFHIAGADGYYHPQELAFLEEVSGRFGVPAARFQQIKARHLPPDEACAYTILGVSPQASREEVKQAYRKLIRACHPDILRSRGLPDEAMQLAEARAARVNAAYAELSSK